MIVSIEIVRIDILLKFLLLSSHLDILRRGHMQQLYHIFGQLMQVSRICLSLVTAQPYISDDRFY